MTKFFTSSGYLSAYGLACGYIDTSEERHVRIEMSSSSGGQYNVIGYEGGRQVFRESFSSLTPARKAFQSRMRQYKLRHNKEAFKQWVRDNRAAAVRSGE